MRYLIEIATDNDAFFPEPGPELARILRQLAERIESAGPEELGAGVRIPLQGGHRFHGKLDSDSTASWTPIPGQAGHLK